MKTLMITAVGQTALDDIPEPIPAAGEVKIRVHRVGLCGSDLSTFRGQNAMAPFPRIPGHEIGGEIVKTGNGVTHCAVGDRVAVLPYTECGTCAACRNGRANACEHNQTLGVQRDGALCAFITVPQSKVIVCNNLGYDHLALVEPLSVGMHVARRTGVDVGEDVVVFGCGVIGLGAIAASAGKGGRVVAVDIDDRKKDIALACGADQFCNSRENSLADLAASLDGGRGPAVVIEAAGVEATYRAAVDLVAYTGRVAYVGYAKKDVAYNTGLFVKKELAILGARNATMQDFTGVLHLLEMGHYPLDRLITGTYPLKEAGKALENWSDDPGSVVKTIIAIQ